MRSRAQPTALPHAEVFNQHQLITYALRGKNVEIPVPVDIQRHGVIGNALLEQHLFLPSTTFEGRAAKGDEGGGAVVRIPRFGPDDIRRALVR